MSAIVDGTAGFLSTGGFREMMCVGQPTVLLGSLPDSVNSEAIFVVIGFSGSSVISLRLPLIPFAIDRGAKQWYQV